TGTLEGEPLQLPGRVSRVAFSRDGSAILGEARASETKDPVAMVWDFATRYRIGPRFCIARDAGGPRLAFDAMTPSTWPQNQLVTWIQLITGKELSESGGVRHLTLPELLKRRDELEMKGMP